MKTGLKNLFFTLFSNYPETYMALSYFENYDFEAKNYLKLMAAPARIVDGRDNLDLLINNFVYSTSVSTRDVSAVIREAEQELSKYKDVGGSILYILTSTGSSTNDTVVETEIAERLLANNIKLIVGESGPLALGQSLSRFTTLSQGSYYFRENWQNTGYFTPINNEINSLCGSGLTTQRRIVS